MLWLPGKQRLKAMARVRRRRRRRRIARILLFLFIFFGLVAASPPPKGALMVEVHRVTAPHQFDFIDWESWAVAGEIRRRWAPPALPEGYAGQRALVQAFLDLEARTRPLQEEINRVYATSSDPEQQAALLEEELAALKAQQVAITPQVEWLLSQQVGAILKEEGFALAGQVAPPVAFRFIDPPTGLVLSPRDRIEKQHFIGLLPGLDTGLRTRLEDAIDRRGDVSGYVTDVGGLGSYPTMVVTSANLIYLIEVIAHEWVHNYLYTFPTNIAWGYQKHPPLTTINETTADIVGEEVARKVITRFYPDLVDHLPPTDSSGRPAPREPSEFDLAMRRIRQEVDHLLAGSKIEEAEAFMEAERLKLVEKGYILRRLNQAYFAFHGSYALSPASVDPIGPQIRRLRAAAPTLKIFLDNMGWLNSHQDYLRLLAEAGNE